MYKEKNKNYKMHECSICLESLFMEIPCALKCGHVFHYKCIKHQEDLLPVSGEGIRDYRGYHCPLCRTSINPWNGDIILLSSLVDGNISNISNLEYGLDLISNFEVKNITILNQRLKFYLADFSAMTNKLFLLLNGIQMIHHQSYFFLALKQFYLVLYLQKYQLKK